VWVTKKYRLVFQGLESITVAKVRYSAEFPGFEKTELPRCADSNFRELSSPGLLTQNYADLAVEHVFAALGTAGGASLIGDAFKADEGFPADGDFLCKSSENWRLKTGYLAPSASRAPQKVKIFLREMRTRSPAWKMLKK
jgi:hypothetical protein